MVPAVELLFPLPDYGRVEEGNEVNVEVKKGVEGTEKEGVQSLGGLPVVSHQHCCHEHREDGGSNRVLVSLFQNFDGLESSVSDHREVEKIDEHENCANRLQN